MMYPPAAQTPQMLEIAAAPHMEVEETATNPHVEREEIAATVTTPTPPIETKSINSN